MKHQFERARIFCVIFIPILFMWGIMLFGAFKERVRVVDSSSSTIGQLLSLLEEQIKGLFKTIELSLYSSERWISTHPYANPATSAEFINLIDGFRRLSDNKVDITIISPSGDLQIIPKRMQPAMVNVSDHEYFKAQFNEATRGFYIGSPVKSKITNEWLIPVSIPVNSASRYAGVILATIELKKIIELLEKSRIKPNGTIAILSPEGLINVRVPFNEKMIGKPILEKSELYKHRNKDIETFMTDGNITDGVTRLVSFSKLKDFPIIVSVSSAMDDILETWKKLTIAIIGIGTGVTFFVVFFWFQLLDAIRSREEAQKKLEYQAKIDVLTGLRNRRAFLEKLDSEIERSHRYSRPLSLLMIDLDYFKKINDRFGHSAGDEVLRSLGKLFCDTIRGVDIAGRIGGEEFCILLPEADIKSATDVAERIRGRFEKLKIIAGNSEIRATLSIGVSRLLVSDSTPETIMERADKALYLAKDKGRNRVEAII